MQFSPESPVQQPNVLFCQNDEQLSLCNTFNSAVRDIGNGQEMNPIVLQEALSFTMTEHNGGDPAQNHVIMKSLVEAGLQVPGEWLPPEYQMYGTKDAEAATRTTGDFGAASSGVIFSEERPFESQPPAFLRGLLGDAGAERTGFSQEDMGEFGQQGFSMASEPQLELDAQASPFSFEPAAFDGRGFSAVPAPAQDGEGAGTPAVSAPAFGSCRPG